jgi:hypothetical protein
MHGSVERSRETDEGNLETAPGADSNWHRGGVTKLDNLVMLCRRHRVSRVRLRGSDVEAGNPRIAVLC